jgi:uncharacterized membrane protein YdfJ with MMPL/SSD domain
VLGLAFGALFAALTPIVTALVAIGIGYALTGLLSHVITIVSFAPILGVLIGLGVGIDYALFIVTRHRSAVRAYDLLAKGFGPGFNGPFELVATLHGSADRAAFAQVVRGGAPVEMFLPVIMFSVLFGLSMDYEVSLVSRIREEWDRTGDNRVAVTRGQALTGRVITAAATIMVLVFLSFRFNPNIIIQQFGVGLAAAIIIDAFVVRTVLVPALMHLCGRANWRLPGWLDRALPTLHVDGARARTARLTGWPRSLPVRGTGANLPHPAGPHGQRRATELPGGAWPVHQAPLNTS